MQTEQIEQRGAQVELNKPVADQPIETVIRKGSENRPRCCGKNCASCPCRGLCKRARAIA